MAPNMCPHRRPVEPINHELFGTLQPCPFDHPYLQRQDCTLDRVS